MIALDHKGNLATGCTTSGWAYKWKVELVIHQLLVLVYT